MKSRKRSVLLVVLVLMAIVFGAGVWQERSLSFNHDAHAYFDSLDQYHLKHKALPPINQPAAGY